MARGQSRREEEPPRPRGPQGPARADAPSRPARPPRPSGFVGPGKPLGPAPGGSAAAPSAKPAAELPAPARWAAVVGAAAFWPALHSSPYYPSVLSPAFAGTPIEALSAQHIVYSLALAALFVLAMALRRSLGRWRAHAGALAVGAGLSGAAGCALMAWGSAGSWPDGAAVGVSLALAAVYAASFLLMWLSLFAGSRSSRAAADLMLSYALYAAAWALLQGLAPAALPAAQAACPLLSALLMTLVLARAPMPAEEPAPRSLSSLSGLRLGLGLAMLALVCFGAVSVRMFTTMETGESAAGNLGAVYYVVTWATMAAGCLACSLLLASRGAGDSALLAAFALLALVYVAALLLILAGGPEQALGLVGRRVLVGAEHCMEGLLAAMLVHEASRKRLSAALVFGLYGVLVCVAPQFISLDVMLQTGLAGGFARINLTVPIAAVAVFLVAALLVALFGRFSARLAAASAGDVRDRQADLCRKATSGYDIAPRELDVVVYTYRGYSAKRIAEELRVSESTVKTHLAHAYRKLGVHSKQELISLVDSYRGE